MACPEYQRHPKALTNAVVALYREGFTEQRIVTLTGQLAATHKLGDAWTRLNQSTVNRWLKAARDEDPDLQIWHLLNLRRRKPGVYSNWTPKGQIILMPFYERLTDTLYLGPGMDYIPLKGGRMPGNVVGRVERETRATGYPMNLSDAAGPCVAELASMGYSGRDIVRLWEGRKTSHPDKDHAPRVRWLAKELRNLRRRALSYSTISRILKIYSFEVE